jgi:lipopolysaccharide transport system ATP-binding protein
VQTISGTGEATVRHIALLNAAGEPAEVHDVGREVTLEVTVAINAPIPNLTLGYRIKDRLGQNIFGTNTHHKGQHLDPADAGDEITFRFAFPLNLGPGSYSVATALHSADTHLVDNYEWRDLALVFTVINMSRSYFEGCTWLDPQVAVERRSLTA